MRTLPDAIDRMTVVYNEHSRHAATEGQAYLEAVRETYGDILTEIKTDPDPEVTGRALQDSLKQGEVNRVVAIGGDATAAAAALALAHSEVAEYYPDTALAILPAGGKIDMYYSMANGHETGDPVTAIAQDWALEVCPVRAEITPPATESAGPATTRLYRAAASLSIGGGSALTAAYINTPALRGIHSELLHDLRATAHVLTRAKRFTRLEGDRRHLTLDDIYPVMNRMGHYVTFPHVDIEDTVLHRYTVGGKQPTLSALPGLLLHMVGHDATQDAVHYKVSGKPRGGTWLQHDGEAARVSAGSTVAVQRETVPYYLIHPLLKTQHV